MTDQSAYRDYPHLISQGSRWNHRWPMVVSNDPVPDATTPHVFIGPSLLDAAGDLTPLGREHIDARVADMASRSQARYCVVWGPEDCTYYGADEMELLFLRVLAALVSDYMALAIDEPERFGELLAERRRRMRERIAAFDLDLG